MAQDGALHLPVPGLHPHPRTRGYIAVWTKAGKFTKASRIGGLFLNAQDSNTVLSGHEETRVSSDRNLFLAAGPEQSVHSRYPQSDKLKKDLQEDFGLSGDDSSLAARADNFASLALKKSRLTALETITAEAGSAISLTTRYDQAAIAKALDGCVRDIVAATEDALLHAGEFGAELLSIQKSLAKASEKVGVLVAKYATPPLEHTTLDLGKDGNGRQQAALSCQGAGCRISLAGTATDAAGVFEAKMSNSTGASVSSLELKNNDALLKAAEGQTSSSLDLSSAKADLASQDAKLELDGQNRQITLKTGGHEVNIKDSSGFSFNTSENFCVDADKNMQLNAKSISMIKGKFKLSESSLEASASGSVKIAGGMIKIG